MPNEKFLDTQKGKVIVGASVFGALVVVYFILAYCLSFFPFSKATLSQTDYTDIKANFKVFTADADIASDQTKAKTQVKSLRDQFNKINNVKDSLNTAKEKLTSLDDKIKAIETEAQKATFDGGAYKTAYKNIKQDDIDALLTAVKTDLKFS